MSINFSKKEILERIKRFYKLKSNADLARFLEVAPTTISSWISRDSVDYERIFSKCEGVDLLWLLTGETTMEKEESEGRENGTYGKENASTNAKDGVFVYNDVKKKGSLQVLKAENEKLYSDNVALKDKIIALQDKIVVEIGEYVRIRDKYSEELKKKDSEILSLKERIKEMEGELDTLRSRFSGK
ncbi:MAG: helix-turn-helix domain-containing protein [Bacteroidales bacterium]|nr:helix-turn-helix domain-containing protein [Bacteroidales bacterium]